MTSLQLSLQLPWHSIIKLARTSRFPVLHVWNPITRQQFMLCEDALLFQYWDVKLHTGPLMHSGNHSLLLTLPATQLSEDLVTGEGKSDSLTFSLSLSFDHDFLQLCSAIGFALFFSLYLSGVPRRGFNAHSSMAGRLMRRPQSSDSWHLPGETLLDMPTLLASPQTNRQPDSWKCRKKRKETNASRDNLKNTSYMCHNQYMTMRSSFTFECFFVFTFYWIKEYGGEDMCFISAITRKLYVFCDRNAILTKFSRRISEQIYLFDILLSSWPKKSREHFFVEITKVPDHKKAWEN